MELQAGQKLPKHLKIVENFAKMYPLQSWHLSSETKNGKQTLTGSSNWDWDDTENDTGWNDKVSLWRSWETCHLTHKLHMKILQFLYKFYSVIFLFVTVQIWNELNIPFFFSPIYAFHTRFDKNGFFMGGTSGFHGVPWI